MSRHRCCCTSRAPTRAEVAWFENTTTSGQRQAAAAVDAGFGRCPAPSNESLVQSLTSLGMAADAAHEYIRNQLALRRFGDVWVRWGDSTADRAEAVLHVRGTPTTPEDIFTAIGTDSASYRALRETLYADPDSSEPAANPGACAPGESTSTPACSTKSPPASTPPAEKRTSTS